jgi:hypothetical protein
VQAAAIVDEWRAAAIPSIAIHVAASSSEQRADTDDHRTGEIWAVAVARGDDGVVTVLCGEALAAVAALLSWWAEPCGPYVVVHGGQAALGRLSRTGPSVPTLRLGCTQIAAVLLAEGTRGGDPPDLRECVRRVLHHDLIAPARVLDDASDGYVQCAVAASAVHALVTAMVPMLRRRGLTTAYRLECALIPAVVAMERAGMPCDAAAFERIAATWRDERGQRA